MDEKKKKIVHKSIIILVIVSIISILFGIMLKYEIEGETNMPFELTKISVISTAIGEQKENTTNKWDLNIIQKNDIYFQIEKNNKFKKDDKIKSVTIENMQISKAPLKGTINLYRPASEGVIYKYSENYEAKDGIKYTGTMNTNMRNLEIGNQGGLIGISIAMDNIGEYISNEDETITHDGTLLQKLQITEEELKSQVKFDLVIETQAERIYKSTITLDLPVGEIIQNGSASKEDVELENIIFKRLK